MYAFPGPCRGREPGGSPGGSAARGRPPQGGAPYADLRSAGLPPAPSPAANLPGRAAAPCAALRNLLYYNKFAPKTPRACKEKEKEMTSLWQKPKSA